MCKFKHKRSAHTHTHKYIHSRIKYIYRLHQLIGTCPPGFWNYINDTRIKFRRFQCRDLPAVDIDVQHRLVEQVCPATYCTIFNTLQHTATYCNTLQHTTTHWTTRQHTATHYTTLQHASPFCNTLQHTTLQALGLLGDDVEPTFAQLTDIRKRIKKFESKLSTRKRGDGRQGSLILRVANILSWVFAKLSAPIVIPATYVYVYLYIWILVFIFQDPYVCMHDFKTHMYVCMPSCCSSPTACRGSSQKSLRSSFPLPRTYIYTHL